MIRPRKIFRLAPAVGAIVTLNLFFWTGNPAMAKRGAPREVEPVIYHGVKYSANHAKMGYVEASDMKTGGKLWEQQIYEVQINPRLETDVQWIFITDLKIKNGKLIIKNEAEKIYELDLKTRKVKMKKISRKTS